MKGEKEGKYTEGRNCIHSFLEEKKERRRKKRKVGNV